MLDAAEYQAFLEERRTGIGGSDIAAILYLPPYGCARRACYEKRGTAPDYPAQRTGAQRRGQELEDLIARRYSEETGRRVVRRKMRRNDTVKFLIANVDREIIGEPNGPAPLEVKSASGHAFRAFKRDGLSEAYIWQLQHYMWVTDRTWGAFAVLDVESWEMVHFDVPRDVKLYESIMDRLVLFWKCVRFGPLPEQLAPTDKRCARCPYRRTCWGPGLEAALPPDDRGVELETDESLAEVLIDLQEAEQYATEAQGTVDTIKTVLRDRLGARQAVQCAGYRVYYRPRPGNARIDRKALEQKHPEIAQEFTVHDRPSRPLRIYPV